MQDLIEQIAMETESHEHGNWDSGGYCNTLVLDDEGYGDVCGWREPVPVSHPEHDDYVADETMIIKLAIQGINTPYSITDYYPGRDYKGWEKAIREGIARLKDNR